MKATEPQINNCNVCNTNTELFVGSSVFGPSSFARCAKCLEKGFEPLGNLMYGFERYKSAEELKDSPHYDYLIENLKAIGCTEEEFLQKGKEIRVRMFYHESAMQVFNHFGEFVKNCKESYPDIYKGLEEKKLVGLDPELVRIKLLGSENGKELETTQIQTKDYSFQDIEEFFNLITDIIKPFATLEDVDGSFELIERYPICLVGYYIMHIKGLDSC